MSRLTDRLERDLRELAAGAQPSPSAWESIAARLDDDLEPEVELVLAPTPARSRRPVWLAAAAALVVIAGSVAVLSMAGDDEPFSAADLTTTFVSPRNGFSMQHPDGAAVTAAEQIWGYDDGFDVVDMGSGTVFKGVSQGSAGLGDESIDQEVDESVSELLSDGCAVPRREQEAITIDGVLGRIAECSNHIEATVVTDEQLYLFTLTRVGDDARAIFDALLATIDLTPETRVDFPGLTSTFRSPTYGYSLRYFHRGPPQPATELWDPSNQPAAPSDLGRRFDGVETGFGAYFEAASTPIPDGVAIDEWVDRYVTPRTAGGCGQRRSLQTAITIDGQPGRVAECRHTMGDRTEATVVAGGRLYLFVVLGDRAWFDAWIPTIELTPETAAVP